MMKPELLPCPFCGGTPYLANVAMTACAYVVCTDCRMQSDDGIVERVVAAWNTRADLAGPQDTPALTARIEELEAKLAMAEDRANAFATKEYHTEARAKVAEAKLAKALEGLSQCEAEIDAYIRHEYPGDHPVQARYRQRDFAANPARITLAALEPAKGDTE